jgi:peptidylprolyl isomerase
MPAASGNTVRVHYTGTLDDGSLFDTSEGREPLVFTVGDGAVIAGFEAGVTGMEPGEKRTVRIEPEEAYGLHNDELVHRVENDLFAEQPYFDAQVELVAPDGSVLPGRIIEVGDTESVLDFNHPLAGQTLTFEIELVEMLPGPQS